MINIPIVFTIDYKFLPPAYIAIDSLIKNADDTTKYDIHVLYNGVIDKKVNLLKRNIKGTRHNMVIHDVSKLQIFVPKTTKCWPNIVYIRLYLPQILKQYDKVIYSDVDVLFLGDLADAYNTEINGYMWAGVAAEKNSPYVLMHQYYNENHHEYIYWSGFMVMNLDEMIKVGMADLQLCKSPGVLTTLGLGSCVGVALYDPVNKIGGLLHCMLPDSTQFKNNSNTAKYADSGIDELVSKMVSLGANRSRIVAKIAGGAQMFAMKTNNDTLRVGERNVEAVKKKLSQMGIRLLSEDCGLNYGRTVEFYTENGDYVIKSVGKPRKVI